MSQIRLVGATAPFQIQQFIGKGAMGQVYLALQAGKSVALKFLNPELPPDFLPFFRNEVRLLSTLSHPVLAQVFDYYSENVGLLENRQKLPASLANAPFFSMEYIAGRDLDDPEQSRDPETLLQWFVQVLQGLDYLHSRNVLHRDLKPSNIKITEGNARILDFSLSARRDQKGVFATPLGTLPYMAPEAFRAEYDQRSDLFSLGVTFYRALSGKLPYAAPLKNIATGVPAPESLAARLGGGPDYFFDIIHRMIEPSPLKRPESAYSILRFLSDHMDAPVLPAERSGAVTLLRTPPLIGREPELESLQTASDEAEQRQSTQLVSLRGPMGSGRSRLIEELKWQTQLAGKYFLGVSPERSSAWMETALHALGQPVPPDSLGQIQALRLAQRASPGILVLEDLHEWRGAELKSLLNYLAATADIPWLIVLESRDEATGADCRNFFESLRPHREPRELKLGDLPAEDAALLLRQASAGTQLPAASMKRILEASGGRPLLLIEGLRAEWQAPDAKSLASKTSRESIFANRIEQLSREAQELLALILAHRQACQVEILESLWPRGEAAFLTALAELDRENFLAARRPEEPRLALKHPGMRDAWIQALGDDPLRQAHGQWLEYLESNGTRALAEPPALAILEHAWELGRYDPFKDWGLPAVERLLAGGRPLDAVHWLERMLPHAADAESRAKIQAHLAPLHFQFGKFSEAERAYDAWFKDRVDDAGRLQWVKYLYYTGFTRFSADQGDAAAERFRQCLAAGQADRYPEHRPYLARAHCGMAVLAERAGELEEAAAHLRSAAGLAVGHPGILGEIEQCAARLAELGWDFSSARGHLAQSVRYFREAKQGGAEAMAVLSIAAIDRMCGDPEQAARHFGEAATLFQQRGDILQWARAMENLSLAHFDRGDYRETRRLQEEVRDILEMLATPRDWSVVTLQQAVLFLHVGNFRRVEKILREFDTAAADADGRRLADWLGAEYAYVRGDYRESVGRFVALLDSYPREPKGWIALTAYLGVCRGLSRLRCLTPDNPYLQAALNIVGQLDFPEYRLWCKALPLLAMPAENWNPEDLRQFFSEAPRAERPELRLDLYGLFRLAMARAGLEAATRIAEEKLAKEWNLIYQNLAEENKMDYEKNREFSKLDQAFQKALGSSDTPNRPEATTSVTTIGPVISEARFRQYTTINRHISKNTDLSEILEKVMDAALELTGAERGFILLKNPKAKNSPLAGYEVKTARHISQRSLKEKEFQFSLSAVRQGVERGSYLITDNAQADSRLKGQDSVVMFGLKSIFVLPMESDEDTIGVIYLDHPYREGCFSEENVLLLSALAGQAGLAVQKAQILEALTQAKAQLESKVEDQAQQLEAMSEKLAQVRSELKYTYEDIVGHSAKMMKVFELLDHVTETSIPVWILGESGTGKELVARALHNNSPRKKASFVAENCSAIPETLLESELFGHKKGAFTHADRDRIGLFEQASGGSLFLDEIADMSLAMQAKLLRVLQEGEVRPLGSTKPVKVDVRLITASNRDLPQMVKEGKFRQDLFYRVNGLTVRLPPLRERKEDIPLLAEFFIKKFSREQGLKPAELGEKALRRLLHYTWPGNIRELEGAMRTALLFAKGKSIQPEHLNLESNPAPTGYFAAESGGGSPQKPEEESAERQMILKALADCGMDKDKAAKKLGMGLRTLYTRMGQLKIPKKKTLLREILGIS